MKVKPIRFYQHPNKSNSVFQLLVENISSNLRRNLLGIHDKVDVKRRLHYQFSSMVVCVGLKINVRGLECVSFSCLFSNLTHRSEIQISCLLLFDMRVSNRGWEGGENPSISILQKTFQSYNLLVN